MTKSRKNMKFISFAISVKFVKSAPPLEDVLLLVVPNEGEQVVKTAEDSDEKIVKFVNFAITVKIVKSAAPLFVSAWRKIVKFVNLLAFVRSSRKIVKFANFPVSARPSRKIVHFVNLVAEFNPGQKCHFRSR